MSPSSLADSHEAGLYRTLVKSLNNYAIFCIGPDGKLASWNTGVERTLGYREEEFVGQPFEQIFTPEDRQSGIPGRELERARQNGQASDERWHVRKDGTRLFADGIVEPAFDDQGELLSFTKVLRDSTGRLSHQVDGELSLRLSEQAHALDLTSTFVRELDGTITTWLAGAEALYGWTRAEAEGRICHELLQTRFAEPLAEITKKVLERGEWQGELEHVSRDGSPVSVLSRWLVHQGIGQKHAQIIEVNLDSSEHKRMQRALEQANEELSMFAYGIAHDLQSPLRGIGTSAQLLLRAQGSNVSELERELLDSIVSGSKKLHELVDGLLHYATSHAHRSESTTVDLNGVMCRVVTHLHNAIAECGAEVRWVELPSVVGHPERLLQVLQNLVSNALKYRHTNRIPRVEVTTESLGDR